jgi:hypothetical protein
MFGAGYGRRPPRRCQNASAHRMTRAAVEMMIPSAVFARSPRVGSRESWPAMNSRLLQAGLIPPSRVVINAVGRVGDHKVRRDATEHALGVMLPPDSTRPTSTASSSRWSDLLARHRQPADIGNGFEAYSSLLLSKCRVSAASFQGDRDTCGHVCRGRYYEEMLSRSRAAALFEYLAT